MGLAVMSGLVTLACRASRDPLPTAPVAPAQVASEPRPAPPDAALVWSPLPSTIRWPAGALAIALPPGEPAAWLLPPFEPGLDHPLERLDEAAHGERVALARSGDLVVVTERDEGVQGAFVLPPEITWIGLGEGDRVLAVDARGRVHAGSVAEALARGLSPTGAVLDGARSWDAAGARMVAAVGAEVVVSDDGGGTFRRSTLDRAAGARVAEVVVRPDGVIAARVRAGRSTVYLSDDGGERWRESAWQPAWVWREDAWIMGMRANETGVLSSDGRSWVGGLDRDAALAGYARWSRDFFPGSLQPHAKRWPTPSDPPAPPPAKRPLRGRGRESSVEGGVVGGVVGGGLGFLDAVGGSCVDGLRCLHGSVGDAPLPARLDVRLFGDVRCDGDASPCPPERWRSPHVGTFDHVDRTLRLDRIPRRCTHVDVASVRGLGLLACEHDEGWSLLTVAPDGTVHHELDVTEAKPEAKPEVGYVVMAEDGTILVPEIPACDRWARAWVRRPIAPGEPGPAWTMVTVEGARAWRPVGRGFAVAVVDHQGRDATRADLWLAGPQGEPVPVLEGIPLTGGVDGVRVDDGRVSLHLDRWRVVRRDGSLAEVELPSRERVVNGVTVTRARPWLGCQRAQ